MSESFAGPTVETARRSLVARFKSGGIDSAELDARMMAGAVLGLDLTGLIAAAGHALAPEEAIRLEEFARRRLKGEPVARDGFVELSDSVPGLGLEIDEKALSRFEVIG